MVISIVCGSSVLFLNKDLCRSKNYSEDNVTEALQLTNPVPKAHRLSENLPIPLRKQFKAS